MTVPISQFGTPRGPKGWLAARLVARLTADSNRWMIDCLEVEGDDCVLDVGCGPGTAVTYAAERCRGLVVGVDAAPAMVRHATRRNRSARRLGRVEIRQADAGRLPFPDASFTKVGSLNSLQFWDPPDQGLGEMYRVLQPGGRVAVVLMARSDDPPGEARPTWIAEIIGRMESAGFTMADVASQQFGGVWHRALLGSRTTVPCRQNSVGPKKNGAPLDPTADGVRKGAKA